MNFFYAYPFNTFFYPTIAVIIHFNIFNIYITFFPNRLKKYLITSIKLENTLDGVKNYNIAVKKRGDDITFLRRIVRGGADGSYGIDVAKLAGVPESVVRRARAILKSLEAEGIPKKEFRDDNKSESGSDFQLSFEQNNNDEILDELKALDVNTLTPIEAMSKLYELSNKAKQ